MSESRILKVDPTQFPIMEWQPGALVQSMWEMLESTGIIRHYILNRATGLYELERQVELRITAQQPLPLVVTVALLRHAHIERGSGIQLDQPYVHLLVDTRVGGKQLLNTHIDIVGVGIERSERSSYVAYSQPITKEPQVLEFENNG